MSWALPLWVTLLGHMAGFAAVLRCVMAEGLWKGSSSWEGAELMPVPQRWPGAAPASPPLGEVVQQNPTAGELGAAGGNAEAVHGLLHRAGHRVPGHQGHRHPLPCRGRGRAGAVKPPAPPAAGSAAPSWPGFQCCFPGTGAFVVTCWCVWAHTGGCRVQLCLYKPVLPPLSCMNLGCAWCAHLASCPRWDVFNLLWVTRSEQSIMAPAAAEPLQGGSCHSDQQQEWFVAVRGVGVFGARRVGCWCCSGCRDSFLSHFLAKHRVGTTENVRPCSSILSGETGAEGLAVPRGVPAPQRGETSLVSSFSVHFTYAEASVCPGPGKCCTWMANHTGGAIFTLLSRTGLH